VPALLKAQLKTLPVRFQNLFTRRFEENRDGYKVGNETRRMSPADAESEALNFVAGEYRKFLAKKDAEKQQPLLLELPKPAKGKKAMVLE
jgi:hypothetical protein